MTRSCFGDLGGVKNCWGYRLKLVRSQDEIKLHDNTIFSKDKDTDYTIVRRFSMKELQKATKNFSTLVGKGGFSSYYKGNLENGTLLMIQVLLHSQVDENRKQDLDFASTVSTLSQIRHRNVVQLIGCCFANDRTIIVYEFVGDYNLDQLLFGNLKVQGSQLDWSMRVFICVGIARGLEYLHEGASHRIVHRNVKPSKIVLDGNFNPKIVGFGLAQVFDDDISHHSGEIVGTLGYLDPEYFGTGRYNEKVDVYAFGILLLEVISGRKLLEFGRDGYGFTLVSWVWELRESDRILEIVDPTLSDFPEDEVKRFVDVALSCVQPSSNLRPSMSEALLMLLGHCELSKKELRNPEQSLLSSYNDEVDSPNHSLSMEKDAKMFGGFKVKQLSVAGRSSKGDEGKNPMTSRVRVPLFGSDPVSANPTFGSTEDFLASRSTFTSVPNQPATRSISKGTRGFETEIESDIDSHSSASELMEISHDLETELYTSVEENISTLTYASGPSDENAVNPELVSPSSLTKRNLAVNQEAVEGLEASKQNPVSHNLEDEIQMGEPSTSEFLCLSAVKDKVKVTSSAEIDSFIQNESADQIPVQAEIIERTEVLLGPKIDMKRPIQYTLEKILEALKDVDHRRICLYGRGGSGKTTVLKNLFHHPATKELFDQVLFLSVPRFAYKKHLQDEIVQQLPLDIKETCSEDEIFCLIHQALIDRKFLLLLDDVRDPINLHEVGIPIPSPENSCWLVSATRSLGVCHLMADREIGMEVLSNAEAWEFFCCQVQGVIDSPEIEPYAQAISKECYGSPVIISAVGNALRGEGCVKEWELALKNLQLGDKVNIDDQCFFRQHIEYCYDRLKARDVKTCFLYTVLFQEDREIDVSMLVECFIKEGLASYHMGHDIVRRLTNASLLEANDNGLKVRMHNVVRDSALEILSSREEGYQALVRLPNSGKDEHQSFPGSSWVTKLVDNSNALNIQLPTTHKYLTRAGAHLKDSPSIEEWEQATMIFLMDNELSSVPNKLNCSTLVALLLQRNSCLRVIPASFFDSMSTLKILNLSKTRIKSLPDSFSRLISLKILLLRDCERLLVLPPSIGLLKSLEVLDLQGTEVTHLPDCVGELASLELLSVSFYGSMNHSEYKRLPSKLVSDGIILSLRVRELGIFVYPGDQRWISNASNITKEISNLNLSALSFHFPKVENLEFFVHESKSWKSRILSTFSIVVGHDFKRVVSLDSNDAEVLFNEGPRRLRFVNGEDIPDVVVEILTRATSFYLDHHLTISYLSQFGISSFDGVKICILRDCPKLIEIMDEVQQRTIFPVLENLSINNLWNLERIWVGRITMGSLARLRCLSVHACRKLRYVFTCSMLDTLSNLEELVIEDCASLEYIVIGDKDVKKIMWGDDVVSVANVEGLPVLRSLKVLKLHYLPQVCGIWRGRWPLLEYISFYSCPRLRNLHMKVDDDVQIKEIATDKAWWDSLFWNDLELYRRLHKHLTQIHIDDLDLVSNKGINMEGSPA